MQASLRFWSSSLILFFKQRGSFAFNYFSAGSDHASAKFYITVKGLFTNELNFIVYMIGTNII